MSPVVFKLVNILCELVFWDFGFGFGSKMIHPLPIRCKIASDASDCDENLNLVVATCRT